MHQNAFKISHTHDIYNLFRRLSSGNDTGRLPASVSGEQMGQDLTALARIEARSLDPCEAFARSGGNGRLCHGAIGPASVSTTTRSVRETCARLASSYRQPALCAWNPRRSISTDVAGADQGLQRVLPRRVVAIALVDPVPTIDVGHHVERVDAPRDIRRTDDEPLGQFPVQKLEDIVGCREYGRRGRCRQS